MIGRALLAAAAAGAAVAAAGVVVVALAFALYALAQPMLGSAGAAAAVAGAAALLLLIGMLVLAIKAGMRRREPSLGEKVLQFAREKPLVAAAAALAASVFAVRNPAALMSVVVAFMEGRSGKKR